ncbi:MAG TPA: hypothetical protein VM370_06210 [Candidatus Thermoplasmatota archaeon]|nr:hypothetical protein [Candidatus Thermoplasmatota archaeon]
MLRTLVITAMIALALVPQASAAGCIPEEATLVAAGGLYVTASGGVYQESNGKTGLQSTGGSCTDDNGRDSVWGADTKLL